MTLQALCRAPRFAVACVFTLGFALAGVATLIDLLETFVFRRLAVPAPTQLVAFYPIRRAGGDETSAGLSSRQLHEMSARQQVLTGVCGVTAGYLTLSVQFDSGVARQRPVEAVTGDCYRLLGVRAMKGRLITAEDGPIDGEPAPVVVISARLWREIGSPADVVGHAVRVEGAPLTIVGVFPEAYRGVDVDEAADLALPITWTWRRRFAPPLAMHALGRLRPQVGLAPAATQLTSVWRQVAARDQSANASASNVAALRVVPLANGLSRLRERYRQPLYALAALGACLLLLACVNIGSLSLARVLDRREAIAVQLALGANRWHVARQMLAEAIAIGGIATVIAVPIAWSGARLAARCLWPGLRAFTVETTPLATTLVFTACIAVLASIFVAVPGWVALRVHQWQLSARSVGHGAPRGQRRSVIAVQIALCFVLACAAVVFTSNLRALRELPLGYEIDRLHWVRLEATRRASLVPTIGYADTLLARISALPGVELAAISQSAFGSVARADTVPVRTDGPNAPTLDAIGDRVSPGFFRTMQIPLQQGREFTWDDVSRSSGDEVNATTGIVVVNRALADRLFPNGTAVGNTIRVRTGVERSLSIVGIVADASPGDPRLRQVPQYYLPLGAVTPPAPSLVLRVNYEPAAESLRRIVEPLGMHSIAGISSMPDQIGRFLAQEQLITSASWLFAALAGIVSVAGIYAAMSQNVVRRRREVGVRVALGATPNAIRALVLSEACAILIVGLGMGAAAALVLRPAIRVLLSSEALGVATVLAITGGALAIIVLAVTAWPAQKAARTPPAIALRSE